MKTNIERIKVCKFPNPYKDGNGENDDIILIYTKHGSLQVDYSKEMDMAYIFNFLVKSEYRRHGLGTRLLKKAIGLFGNCNKLFLKCEKKHIEFYQRVGFKITYTPKDKNNFYYELTYEKRK